MDTTPKKKSNFRNWRSRKSDEAAGPSRASDLTTDNDNKEDFPDIMEFLKEYENKAPSPIRNDNSDDTDPGTPGAYEYLTEDTSSPHYVTWDFIKPAVSKDVEEAAKKIEADVKKSRRKRKRRITVSPQVPETSQRSRLSMIPIKDYTDIIEKFKRNVESISCGRPLSDDEKCLRVPDKEVKNNSMTRKSTPSLDSELADQPKLTKTEKNRHSMIVAKSTVAIDRPQTSRSLFMESDILQPSTSNSCRGIQKPQRDNNFSQNRISTTTHSDQKSFKSDTNVNQSLRTHQEPSIHLKASNVSIGPKETLKSTKQAGSSLTLKVRDPPCNPKKSISSGQPQSSICTTSKTVSLSKYTKSNFTYASPKDNRNSTSTPNRVRKGTATPLKTCPSSFPNKAAIPPSPCNYMDLLDDSFNEILLQTSQEVENSYRLSVGESTSASSSGTSSFGNTAIKTSSKPAECDDKQRFLMDTDDDDIFALIDAP